MGTETKYRVGVLWTEYLEDGFTYLMHDSDPTNKKTFTMDHPDHNVGLSHLDMAPADNEEGAALYDAKQVATWVQVLASLYEEVVVERVEVPHG